MPYPTAKSNFEAKVLKLAQQFANDSTASAIEFLQNVTLLTLEVFPFCDLAKCETCNESREHYLHLPAKDCKDCSSPQDHHAFVVKTVREEV